MLFTSPNKKKQTKFGTKLLNMEQYWYRNAE